MCGIYLSYMWRGTDVCNNYFCILYAWQDVHDIYGDNRNSWYNSQLSTLADHWECHYKVKIVILFADTVSIYDHSMQNCRYRQNTSHQMTRSFLTEKVTIVIHQIANKNKENKTSKIYVNANTRLKLGLRGYFK